MAVVRNTIGKDICEALGLDHRKVVNLTLRLRLNEAVMVEVEEYADPDVGDLTRVLTQYRLESVDDEPPPGMLQDPDGILRSGI